MMKCYFCKKEIHAAVRTFIPARNKREKSNFRNLCKDCWEKWIKENNIKVIPLIEEDKLSIEIDPKKKKEGLKLLKLISNLP
jgi:Fe-S cluster biosynthesis and repair protein YggX